VSASCATYRALLGRWVERETTPEEALQLARHLPDCTACRIVLSREIRLARMLEGLADSIAVEEGFLRTVMRSLPAGPPPAGRRHRGLKLAGLGGALLLTGIGAARLAELLAGGRAAQLLPRLALPRAENVLETLGGIAGAVWAVLDQVNAGALFGIPAFHIGLRVVCLAALLPAALAALSATTLALLIARARCRR